MLFFDLIQRPGIHTASRGAVGARTIAGQLTQQGEKVGRYKAASLMKEAHISSKQPRQHHYKLAEDEPKAAPHLLQRKFRVEAPNQVWCGDVTYMVRRMDAPNNTHCHQLLRIGKNRFRLQTCRNDD